MSTNDADDLEQLSRGEIERVLALLPNDPFHRAGLFIDVLRALDYATVYPTVVPEERGPKHWESDLIRWGWGLAAKHLYTPLSNPGIPARAFKAEHLKAATALLYSLGQATLIHRAADMARCGILVLERESSTAWSATCSADIGAASLDILELDQLSKTEAWLEASDTAERGWTLVDHSELGSRTKEFGAFFTRRNQDPLQEWLLKDVRLHMEPLVRPWDSGYGVMIGYDALPNVDQHFFAVASEHLREWHAEAGLHDTSEIGGVAGGLITAVAEFIVSFHIKHVTFALIAKNKYPQISFPQSLTIWSSRAEFVANLAAVLEADPKTISHAVAALSLSPCDAGKPYLQHLGSPPLLVDFGNDMLVKPVASAARNPLHTIRVLGEGRDPNVRNNLSSRREAWLREEIYSMFMGARYLQMRGNMKVRKGRQIETDIDAGLLDTTTGEIALFQIKWQDFATNDVRQLRSKAKNLSEEMSSWASKVSAWLERLTHDELLQTFQLRGGAGRRISAVHLFGIARHAARTRAYGYPITHPALAVGTWPQFQRLRMRVGPARSVFTDMHNALKAEANAPYPGTPVPVVIEVAGKQITFANLWSSVPED